MRCLVTGGSGFIGSHLVQKLQEAGHDVAVLDLKRPRFDVEWLEHDIRMELGNKLQGFEIVYHLAALANARKSFEHPQQAYSINVIGSLNLLQAALKADIQRVFLASTSWVAGAQVNSLVDEATPFNLLDINTVYGATKLSQEMAFYSFHSEFGGPDYTILRYGIPYGERMWKGLVVRAFMDMAERTGTINIMGDGKQYREFLYVKDLCDAHILALNPTAVNRVYNLTGNQPVTVEELAKEVVKYLPAQIDYIPQARVEPKLKRIKNDLAKIELGWEPKTPLVEGIGRCYEWWAKLSADERKEEYWI
jgi:UDP-glucose 4-epimerase